MRLLSLLALTPLVSALANYTNSTNSSSVLIESNADDFQYRGVALGGWLVLEPYITPSLFEAFNGSEVPVDEYHFCEQLGEEEATKRLNKHWSTFYSEDDFKAIKSYGLNMVRIPIGYWAFQTLESDPYVGGAQSYLDQAIQWAQMNELKVWIDLHGVPGSQNGFDNSGLRDIGYPGWFNSTENLDLTYKVLHQIFVKYGGGVFGQKYKDTILGIEVVNEPFSPVLGLDEIAEFYTTAYEEARNIQVINNTIIFHDAFARIGYWNEFMSDRSPTGNNTNENYNILIDHHHYEVFGEGVKNNITTHLQNIVNYASSIEEELTHHPAVVGEWSAALTDCTPWLNGIGLGSRYAGEQPYNFNKTGSCENINNFQKWSKQQKKNYRKFIEIQLDQYTSKTRGYIFWCFKTEDTIEWDFKRLVELDLMPQPLNNFTYIVNGTDTDRKKNMGMKNGVSGLLALANLMLLAIFL
ncbi:glycoside hydrolase family 5 protein [Suhomyces tanzawaensis NRRL Y-17324]|uniref:glucan 1,3-beta-glucosidase n=1 Tax=Suhomyces tanzawaensis NRRL Y-17324 TaxID=984487 RepID=A0A1E4SD01_9ASCO|nr:glycoside hydrolase family 5 protein [Suhomyces tanzawaensis NRRL Y-17324]ODV77397.1 glycoside hydrolase family 5 protein [Suhomyces tanzawaensis NRRL Y-17324]